MTYSEVEAGFDDLVIQESQKSYRSWVRLQDALRRDRILFGSDPLPACLKPHLISARVNTRWVQSSELLCDLVEQAGRLIFREEDLFSQLGFTDEAKDLMAIDPGYDRIAVICRPDCVWNGDGDFFVLEINSDSPAMMTFVDYLEAQSYDLFPLVQLQSPDRSPANRTRALYETLVACNRERGGRSHPTIAIVDWSDVKTLHEQERTAQEFRHLGSDCFTCDPRDLKIENGRLIGKGRKIDLVYRRVLFMDFIRRREELEPLLAAYRDGLVCMVNPLRSYLAGNKMLMAMLHDPSFVSKLSPSAANACRLIAPTVVLDGARAEEIRATRGEWVLKEGFGYGGKNVVIGCDTGEAAWDRVVASGQRGNWIAQRFIPPPQLRVPVFEGERVAFEPRYANWSPWLFGGRFAGGMTRMSANTIVSITQRGALLPSIADERVVSDSITRGVSSRLVATRP